MKLNKIMILAMASICLGITACGGGKKNSAPEATPVVEETPTPEVTPETTPSPDPTPVVEETPTPEATPEPTPSPEPTPVVDESIPARAESIGKSNKNVSELDLDLPTYVNNDKTGNWKYCVLKNNVDFLEYAVSYYKRYMYTDSQIHAIINKEENTTTKISYLSGMLNVTVYQYVDGEEEDANLLFGGNLINQYFVYPDNGDIEKVQ